MDNPELGNNEEEQLSSSAELSESGSDAPVEAGADAGDTPTEMDNTETDTENTPQPTAEAETESVADEADTPDEAEAEATNEPAANGLQVGMVIEGTITRTTPNEVFVEVGEGLEGLVPKREVELMSGKVLEQMQEGASIHVYIVNPNNHRGQIILSINHAQEELDWRSAEEYMNDKSVYDGKIGGYNKGGLIVRFGRLRGFVPQSQISDKRMLDVSGETPEERYGGLVNQNISVKVMEVDRGRNRLILSERAAMREVRARRKEALITELQVGEIREGRVVSLENFGAFVDVGGAEGLVHITELSWKHVTHPRQILDVGQEVQVKVINVDEGKNRIGLSIKQLKADPWDELAVEYGAGSLLRGVVTKLTKFGAFARIEGMEAVEGLIHISELSDERVEHPRDVVQKGDKLTLRVVKVDVKNRRLGLSLRRVNSSEFLDEDLKRAYRDRARMADLEPEYEDDPGDDVVFEDEPEVVADAEPVVDAPVAEQEESTNGSVSPEALEESTEAASEETASDEVVASEGDDDNA